jgi:hypothetical protein
MRLPRPFFRLPLRFDAARLRAEVASLPEAAWAPHPNALPGNHSLRLISVDGGDNDAVAGRMLPTSHLLACPYLRQVLADFGVVWSRSRLMRLDPGASVPEHADINHHWFTRVRVHIPVVTRPEVLFHCGGETVHMAAGEAWVFDNWRPHAVENPTPDTRIHLVADTSGSAAFWRLVAQSGTLPAREHRPDPAREAMPLTETGDAPAVLSPAEVQWLLADLRAELVASAGDPAAGERLSRYHALLDAFVHDWRQLSALHGTGPEGRKALATAASALRAASREQSVGLVMRGNGVAAHRVLEARVLQPLVAGAPAPERPVFIVAAPRSGSTLLFETLATHRHVATLGGEAHWLVEGQPELRPGAPGVDSNRLTAMHATPAIGAAICDAIAARAIDADGAPVAGRPLTFLEKTPKNVLRIPFLAALFPDARFVFLWREPRGNVSSILDAWHAGRWITYPRLDGWDGPWSLLLPPAWQSLRGRPLADVAAWQWAAANRTALDDLEMLPRHRWTVVRHEAFVAAPQEETRRLCAFLGLPRDAALASRLAAALPLSRYTLDPPSADKWRRNAAELDIVLPRLAPLHERLAALHPAS